jgi:hypothetical protein
MANFEITSPDGKKFEITAPEGATQEQVLAYAQSQFQQQAQPPVEKPGILDQLKSGVTTGFKLGGPMGAMLGAVPASSRALDEASYAAGGKVTDAAASAGLPAGAAAGLGYATNVGMQAIPAVLGGMGGKAAAPALEGAAAKLMQSSLKPTLETLRSGKAATAIQTMLDEGVNVSKGGIEKLRGMIGELNREITSAIASSPATVDKGKVASTLYDLTQKVSKQANPQADLKAIETAWTNFLEHPLLVGQQSIPVQLAQQMKQGTYKALGDKAYGMGLKPAAERDALKELARGLKEGVAEAVPAVSSLNAREAALLNALQIAERRVMMEGNKNPVGLTPMATHGAGALGFLADRSGAVKSMLARLLYSGSEAIPQAGVGSGIAAGQGLSDLLRR